MKGLSNGLGFVQLSKEEVLSKAASLHELLGDSAIEKVAQHAGVDAQTAEHAVRNLAELQLHAEAGNRLPSLATKLKATAAGGLSELSHELEEEGVKVFKPVALSILGKVMASVGSMMQANIAQLSEEYADATRQMERGQQAKAQRLSILKVRTDNLDSDLAELRGELAAAQEELSRTRSEKKNSETAVANQLTAACQASRSTFAGTLMAYKEHGMVKSIMPTLVSLVSQKSTLSPREVEVLDTRCGSKTITPASSKVGSFGTGFQRYWQEVDTLHSGEYFFSEPGSCPFYWQGQAIVDQVSCASCSIVLQDGI